MEAPPPLPEKMLRALADAVGQSFLRPPITACSKGHPNPSGARPCSYLPARLSRSALFQAHFLGFPLHPT